MSNAISETIWARVDRNSDAGCWLWTGCRKPTGYAQLQTNGKQIYVHRFFYERLVGPIPEGREIDHLCRVRNCVNPEHLEPVTRLENVRRAHKRTAAITCQPDHEFRMKQYPSWQKAYRVCVTCKKERDRIRNATQ